jgi:hypothetical protein
MINLMKCVLKQMRKTMNVNYKKKWANTINSYSISHRILLMLVLATATTALFACTTNRFLEPIATYKDATD